MEALTSLLKLIETKVNYKEASFIILKFNKQCIGCILFTIDSFFIYDSRRPHQGGDAPIKEAVIASFAMLNAMLIDSGRHIIPITFLSRIFQSALDMLSDFSLAKDWYRF